MSRPRRAKPVKLIVSLFSPEKTLLDGMLKDLSDRYGPVDWLSRELFFDRTPYYAREMGWPLHRRFVSFRDLMDPEELVRIKLETNALEGRHLCDGRRRVNLDPGYMAAERLVLATGKNYVHRVYLSAGIYADLTLVFHRGSFKALPWTYKDYADPEMITSFNHIRERYMAQLREMGSLD